MCDCDYICVCVCVLPHMWRTWAVSMTTQSMWSQEDRRDRGELRKLTLPHLNPTMRAAELNSRYDNCLHCLSPVGDVCTLPPLSCQRVSPRPWPRSTFKFVRNATARLLHPTWRGRRTKKEKRRREEDTQYVSSWQVPHHPISSIQGVLCGNYYTTLLTTFLIHTTSGYHEYNTHTIHRQNMNSHLSVISLHHHAKWEEGKGLKPAPDVVSVGVVGSEINISVSVLH